MAAFFTAPFNMAGREEPERIQGAIVSASLFPLLGVNPYLRRTFSRQEEHFGAHRVAVVSDGLWRRRFGAEPS